MATKNAAKQVTFNEGDVLFRQDEAAQVVYVVNSGLVQLSRAVFHEEFVVETVGPGNLCGEVAIAGGARYPVTATAVEPVTALAVEREAIDETLMSNAEIASRLARKLATRMTHTHFRLGNFALRSAQARVMLQLRQEAIRHGALGGEAFAPIPYDLPQVLALERGRVDAALRDLIGDSIVELDGHGRFRILDTGAYDRLLTYLELKDRFDP